MVEVGYGCGFVEMASAWISTSHVMSIAHQSCSPAILSAQAFRQSLLIAMHARVRAQERFPQVWSGTAAAECACSHLWGPRYKGQRVLAGEANSGVEVAIGSLGRTRNAGWERYLGNDMEVIPSCACASYKCRHVILIN